MDKLLVMSILSSTPADIAGGFCTVPMKTKKVVDKEKDGRKSSSSSEGKQRPGAEEVQRQQSRRTCFAPEFDGLNCFETLVSR